MTGMQAAVGYSQVKRFEKLVEKRRRVYGWYRGRLQSAEVKFAGEYSDSKPSYWLPAVLFETNHAKNLVILNLEKSWIEMRNFFLPIHKQPAYSNVFDAIHYSVADSFYERGLLLPSYYLLTKYDLSIVGKNLSEITK